MRRVLVLFLVICIISGMSASYAAGYVEHLETSEKEAVELLHSLNILDESYETFNPDRLITRADTSRMIYIILRGGNDDGAENFCGQSNTFTDISGHRAEGYINYSFAMGFISGYPNGTFVPDQKITGYAFIKIALAVIGYDAKLESFEGKNWDQNVISRALTSGILKGYDGAPHEPITAKGAASILYNTLYSYTVEYTYSNQSQKTDKTVADTMFGLRTYSGILWATDQAALGMAPLSGDRSSWVDINGDGQLDHHSETFKFTAPTDLLGHHVTVAVCQRNNKIERIYGAFATPGISDETQTYSLASENSEGSMLYFHNFELDEDRDGDGIMDGYAKSTAIRHIDNNGDGKCDIVLSWNYTFTKVTSIRFDEKKQTVVYYLATNNKDKSLFIENYLGLNTVSEGDRIIYLEGNGSMKKGITKVIKPVKGSITQVESNFVYFNNRPYGYSQIEGSLETRPGFGATVENIGKDSLLYADNGTVLEIAPTVNSNIPEKFAYIYQIECIDKRNDFFEEEIYDRSYIAQVFYEDGNSGTHRLRQVDGMVLPGTTDIDVTPKQGLYRYKINSFNQLELTTVYATAQNRP